jgi:hypothetical protein
MIERALPTEGPLLETVAPETYIRAETDRSFHNIVQLNGGAINALYHFRSTSKPAFG